MEEPPRPTASRMPFSLERSLEILGSTPAVLRSLLGNLAEDWVRGNEGPGTWSAFDVVGHLLHLDRANWMARIPVVLGDGPKAFAPFDREAMLRNDQGRSLPGLLDEFARVRASSLEALRSLRIGEAELERTGIHPDFGQVTLRQLLASWTVHDLDHLYQVSRVLAKLYADEVGPWRRYLKVLGGN